MNIETLRTGIKIFESITQIMLSLVSLVLIWSNSTYYAVLGVILFAVVAAWVLLDYKVNRLYREMYK